MAAFAHSKRALTLAFAASFIVVLAAPPAHGETFFIGAESLETGSSDGFANEREEDGSVNEKTEGGTTTYSLDFTSRFENVQGQVLSLSWKCTTTDEEGLDLFVDGVHLAVDVCLSPATRSLRIPPIDSSRSVAVRLASFNSSDDTTASTYSFDLLRFQDAKAAAPGLVPSLLPEILLFIVVAVLAVLLFRGRGARGPEAFRPKRAPVIRHSAAPGELPEVWREPGEVLAPQTEEAPAKEPSPRSVPTLALEGSRVDEMAARLAELNQLLSEGLITELEYDTRRRELLERL